MSLPLPRWAPRLNARPATVAELRANIAATEAELATLDREAGEAAAVAPDDDRYEAAQADLAELRRQGDVKARRLAALRATLAEREAEAAKAEREAQRAALEREAASLVKLAEEIDADQRKLATKRDKLAAHNAKIAAWNSANPGLPIVDSETRYRRIPGRTIPAEIRDEIVWQNAAGERPRFFGQDPSTGEMIPVRGGYTKQKVRVCVREEEVVYPRMPERWATALVLVDREGRRL